MNSVLVRTQRKDRCNLILRDLVQEDARDIEEHYSIPNTYTPVGLSPTLPCGWGRLLRGSLDILCELGLSRDLSNWMDFGVQAIGDRVVDFSVKESVIGIQELVSFGDFDRTSSNLDWIIERILMYGRMNFIKNIGIANAS
ncbi:hypothetical protein NPIL_386711 [Nephila pilipes]|uniref:Uncharacterized protein n=1 Tax=Nephila pilipes TaxID=299642 RepID=A0A8X6NBD1_NEPPI|nr:hypothetical protein NPIL_386711 [Nephila pilipes]